MAQLEWSDALDLNLEAMDHTHREFVDLLAAVDGADDAHVLEAWEALVEHTGHHFAQEDAWMASTRFASGNCHAMQHRVVLQVMREGTARARQGNLQVLRVMASELALWFPQHAQSMDAALALHLRRVGFDPATGVVRMPAALPAQPIHGCGGATCSDGEAPAPALEAAVECAEDHMLSNI